MYVTNTESSEVKADTLWVQSGLEGREFGGEETTEKALSVVLS